MAESAATAGDQPGIFDHAVDAAMAVFERGLRLYAPHRHLVEEAIQAGVRAARIDPALLRWCDWPGCWRSYDATTGPVGEPGWMMHRRPMVLLCPDHDPAGHRPSFDTWTRGDKHLTARCECGASAEVRPANHQAVIDWWTGHIQQLAQQAVAASDG